MNRVASILALIVLNLAGPAHADETADQVLSEIREGGEIGRLHQIRLSGISDGFGWANGKLKDKGQPQIYCQPAKLGLTNEQVVSILREYVKEHPSFGKFPPGLVLMYALENTFPCQ